MSRLLILMNIPSSIHLPYLNQVLQEIFIKKSDNTSAGILIIIPGDGFQLPVVKGQGILCKDLSRLSPLLKEIYLYFTENVFFLELKDIVRQGKYKKILSSIDENETCSMYRIRATYLNEQNVKAHENDGRNNTCRALAPVLAGVSFCSNR